MPRVLIIGYGNPLRGDDAVAWHACERLRALIQDPEVEILTVHQLTPELMEPVSRAQRVIFMDAATGPQPGEIRERPVHPAAAGAAAFSHHATPEALVAGARAIYGHAGEATLITVAAEDFGLSFRLSPVVSGCVDHLAALVLGILKR